MTQQTELLRFGLLALLTGLAIPLAVQLFFVLRELRRVTATLDRHLDHTLRDVGELVSGMKRENLPAPTLVSQLVAAIPAVLAGVHAYRAGLAAQPRPEEPPSQPSHATPLPG
jgi:hypothetical protein